MSNSNRTPEKAIAFCAALAETGIIARACDAVGMGRTTAYEWRESDEEFAVMWDKALKIGITALEDEAHRRAFEGMDEPVFYQGAECGTVRKYSDTLAIFLLKAHNPEKYRDNSRVDLGNADGKPFQVDDSTAAARMAAIMAAADARKKASEGGT